MKNLIEVKKSLWLRISGACGVATPLLAFAFIFLAVAYYPQFSWTDNALSDLGVVAGLTSGIFNFGLIFSGTLAVVFATGLSVPLDKSILGRVGASVLALAGLMLVSIGVFPESVEPTHYLVSVAFFVLLPVSLLITAGAFWRAGQVRTAGFTLLMAAVAALPWLLLFSFRYVSGVAIPEFVSGLAAGMWTVIQGIKMIQEVSRAQVQ